VSRILWITPRPLYPARSGGEIRTSGLIDAAVAAGHQVLVIEAGTSSVEPPAAVELLSLELRSGWSNLVAKAASTAPLRAPRATLESFSTARDRIAGFAPECVVAAEIYSASLATPLVPAGTPWIYDAHNVEADRYRALAATASGPVDRISLPADIRRIERAERNLVRRADATTCVSRGDADRLAELVDGARPVVVPSSVPTPDVPSRPSHGDAVLFVGSLLYPPNVEAVEALVARILPSIRHHVPTARLIVAGRHPGHRTRSLLASQSWIDFCEDLPDLRSVYDAARCVVLPISTGGGSRLKVYEALACGAAIVATPEALLGVPVRAESALVGSSNDELVGHAARVLTDGALADQIGAAARTQFVEELSWRHAAIPMLDLIAQLVGR
jgi:glycosyltransferase involved in cell wall biosynthesis